MAAIKPCVTHAKASSTSRPALRWIVDASGRTGLLKRKLDLAETNGHDANAIWFHIADRIAIDWSNAERRSRAATG
jgi:hypothetical protein